MIHVIARLFAPALLAMLTLLGTVPAIAHAQLLSSDPNANAILDTAPETLRLQFNEPVSPLVITLVAPDGTAADLTGVTTSGAALTVPIAEELGQGTHVLSWRVVSVDAHPVAGSLVFSVGMPTGGAPPEIATGSRVTAALLWGSKAALFVGLFLGLGGAVFALAAPLPSRARPIVAGLNVLGLVAGALSLGLHGADALGQPPEALISFPAWTAAASTSYGATLSMLGAGFALALASVLAGLPPLAWPAWALAAFGLAISGHAGAAEPQWLTRPAVTLHAAGILFWAGALLPLWLWLRTDDLAAGHALTRFSRVIPYAVAPILVSGFVLAIVQLGPPSPAWMTPYGFILAAKLGLLLLLFGLALWNRLGLTGPALAGDRRARLRLRRSVLIELVLVLAIFALAAGWRFTPPPRAIAAAEAAQAALAVPAYAHAMDQAVMADIVATPGRAGPVTFDISVIDLDGNPLDIQALELTLAAPAMGIEPFNATAVAVDGVWRVEGQTIPLPGLWELTLDIRLDRFSRTRIGTEITFN